MAGSSDGKLVIFAGGIAIGGALAIGTAYLVSRQLTAESEEDLSGGKESDEHEQRRPRRPGKNTYRRQSKYRENGPSPRSMELERPANGAMAIPQRKQPLGPSMSRNGSVGRESVFARAGLADNQDPYHRSTVGSPCAAGFFDNAPQNLHTIPRAPSPNLLGDIPMSPSARRMQDEESDFDRFDDGPNPYSSDVADTIQGNSDSECHTRTRNSAADSVYDQGGVLSGRKQNMQKLQQQHSSMPMIGPSDRGGNRVALSVLTHQLSPRAGHPVPFNQLSHAAREAPGTAAPTHSTHQFPANPRGGAVFHGGPPFSPSPPRAPSPMVSGQTSNHSPALSGLSPFGQPAAQQPVHGGSSAHGSSFAGAGKAAGVPAAQSADKPESLFTHIVKQGKIIEDMAMNDQYSRVLTPETQPTEEQEESCAYLKECLDLRDKWLWRDAVPAETVPCAEAACISDIRPDPLKYEPKEKSEMEFGMMNGVIHVWTDETREEVAFAPPGSAYDFFSDMHRMLKIISMGPVKTLCHHRLELLEQKFNLHCMLNADKEFLAQKVAPHRDFYNVRKVDTHIHHSACMHQKHLLRFIKSKLKKEPDEVVIFRDGKYLTLKEVFESLNLTAYDLNVDTLDMHADKNIFHRFDKFNLKYNPCGQSRLREIFIKSDNLIHGRFLAELTQEVMSDLELSKYQHAEWRISIYGRKPVEWDLLASWVCGNRLFSDNMIWLIQLPRLYNVYKSTGIIDHFQQMLDNIFQPLFEVTADPTSHPQLHIFLSHVVGFDCVDDESKPERRPNKRMRPPQDWDLQHNPAFSYYAYYIYANLFTLNKFRESRGLNTFTFRPHCGEAGDIDHLVSCHMLAENIAHGINLRKSPSLQYLYYLAQIGLCMSPLSNNSLFLDYHRNPFPTFFARGLNVSLSTDDPLQIHLTREPLVEEYSVAAQVWKLSAADLCEIARNSVIQSGFPHRVKMHWVGDRYYRMGPDGNDIQKTNVPNLRIRFRTDVYQEDLRFILGSWRLYQERMAAKAEGI